MQKRFWRTSELRAAGKSADEIAAAVRRGEIHRMAHGIYGTEEPTDLVRLAALAWARPGLVYTGRTAGFLHGLQPMVWPAEAAVPRGTSRKGGRYLRLSGAGRTRGVVVDGLPVLTPLATAVACGEVAVWRRRNFLQQAYTGVRGNERLAADLAALGPTDRARAADLTAGLVTGTASYLELQVVRALMTALDGLEVSVEVNMLVRGYRFDIVIPEARVCVEIDSRLYHSSETASAEDFIKDRWKGNAAVRWGWTLLRYPDASVEIALDEVVAEVLDTVEHNLAHPRARVLRTRELPTDREVWWWHPGLRPADR
jgi:very-short-patch-repair endonuclease